MSQFNWLIQATLDKKYRNFEWNILEALDIPIFWSIGFPKSDFLLMSIWYEAEELSFYAAFCVQGFIRKE